MTTCEDNWDEVHCPSMPKKINYPLRGRCGVSATMQQAEPNLWVLRSKSGMIRFGGSEDDPNKISFVDFDGGPFIEIGTDIGLLHTLLPEGIVAEINLVKGKGVCVTTKPIE